MSNVTQDKKAVIEMLKSAILLELSTIPPYMTALLSIMPGQNRAPAKIIRSVMMEEMLHMTLAGNVLSSVGGVMTLDADHIPQYPLKLEFKGKRFKEREFDVDLAPMNERSLTIFTKIEQPEGWDERKPTLKAAVPELEVEGYTIGEFYNLIIQKLTALCQQYGEAAIFTGNPDRQIDPNYYWSAGGQPIKVSDLSSAKKAIDIIVEQGEGTSKSIYDGDKHYFDDPEEVAHFFRFREILFGRFYKAGDNPYEPPTGPQMEVNYRKVYPIKVNATSEDYRNDPKMQELNQSFNREYSKMLSQIAEAFNGSPEALYTAILNGMHDMVGIAQEMVKTPIAGDPKGLHGAPSFEWASFH